MSIGPNQSFQQPGPFAGQAPQTAIPGGYPDQPAFQYAGQYPNPAGAPAVSGAAYGISSLVGQNLRFLDEIASLTGRTLEQSQGAELRQALWQIQQLVQQAKSCSYQIRGMLLQ